MGIKLLRAGELGLTSLVLLAALALPLAELVGRSFFGGGIAGSAPLTQHATLWLALLGAALAAREGKLLALSTGEILRGRSFESFARTVSAAVAAAVSALLARASFELLWIEREGGDIVVPWLPVWVAQLVLPFGFGVLALRLAWRAAKPAGEESQPGDGARRWTARGLAAAGLAAGVWLGQHPEWLEERPAWPGMALLFAAAALGMPLFAVLGGLALLLFMVDGVPIAAVPVETYRLSVSPYLPAIPLFTLAGFLLAEGRAAQRLLDVFRALVGWIPGGTAIVCAFLCAFVTVFTGGSGVTILALGALLMQALRTDGYGERFSLGLLTASGSLGLLLPPAMPLILFGIVASVPIEDLFLAGMLPGILLIVLVALWGMREGRRTGAGRVPFRSADVLPALWRAKYELALPFVALGALFSGHATLVESAAITALYTLFVQVVVRRELSLVRDLPRVLLETTTLLGGVLIILCVAMGLTSYLVDAEIPAHLLEWVQGSITSKLLFLLGLNVFLLLVGCLMDIFSATVVVVPLIVPLGQAFGIDPVHLGIVFVANLELGYLTPPVGLNLFLASYRFDQPLTRVYRAAVPMLVILGFGVLVITYCPFLTTGVLELLGRR